MRVFVIIATKGRAKETRVLLDNLQHQTLAPTFTIVVGTNEEDIAGCAEHPVLATGRGTAVISPKVGLTSQRNYGLDSLQKLGQFSAMNERAFCVFFDDDFRPAPDWLEQANARFSKGDIVGLTGEVLADGVVTGAVTEAQAVKLIAEAKATTEEESEVPSVYGCNMAFMDRVSFSIRFDENLPLYGWLEDRDYTVLASRVGRIIKFTGCIGVHLGASGARVSGIKFGYSQIANPFYLMKKGTVSYLECVHYIVRAFSVNLLRSRKDHMRIDYRGRLKGSLSAFWDIIRGRSDPQKMTGV